MLDLTPNRAHASYVNFAPLRTGGGDRSEFSGKAGVARRPPRNLSSLPGCPLRQLRSRRRDRNANWLAIFQLPRLENVCSWAFSDNCQNASVQVVQYANDALWIAG